MGLFCYNSPGTVITVSYDMHERARRDGTRLNETTLQSTVNKARRHSLPALKRPKEKFNDKLYELLKEEAKDIDKRFI